MAKSEAYNLMPEELLKRFEEIGHPEEDDKIALEDMIVLAHYFNPVGRGNWYPISYYPEDKICFGYVSIFGDWNDEYGDFSLKELEELRLPLGMKIERDMYWVEKTMKEVIKEKNAK